jgi:hypothetical protein
MKLDLLTNATVVDDAIRFVSEHSKNKLRLSSNSNEEDGKGSDEPDCDDQLEEKQEGETGELITNQVF